MGKEKVGKGKWPCTTATPLMVTVALHNLQSPTATQQRVCGTVPVGMQLRVLTPGWEWLRSSSSSATSAKQVWLRSRAAVPLAEGGRAQVPHTRSQRQEVQRCCRQMWLPLPIPVSQFL